MGLIRRVPPLALLADDLPVLHGHNPAAIANGTHVSAAIGLALATELRGGHIRPPRVVRLESPAAVGTPKPRPLRGLRLEGCTNHSLPLGWPPAGPAVKDGG